MHLEIGPADLERYGYRGRGDRVAVPAWCGGLAHGGCPAGHHLGALAQLVERCLCKADVRSSNLLGSTNQKCGERRLVFEIGADQAPGPTFDGTSQGSGVMSTLGGRADGSGCIERRMIEKVAAPTASSAAIPPMSNSGRPRRDVGGASTSDARANPSPEASVSRQRRASTPITARTEPTEPDAQHAQEQIEGPGHGVFQSAGQPGRRCQAFDLGAGAHGEDLSVGWRPRYSVGAESGPETLVADWLSVTSPIQTATATLHTNRGDIKIALFGNHAPKTVANFVGLAQGTRNTAPRTPPGSLRPVLRRRRLPPRDPGFMIQGGDPTGTGRGGPGYRFDDEFHPELVFDKPYLLAMANAGPGTNGSQFFITVGKTPHLNRKHTIFGEVVDPESQKVVDAIATTAVDRSDRPNEPVVIESITVS